MSQRILVIDDEPAVHADFQNVLGGAGLGRSDGPLDALEDCLFGASGRVPIPNFSVSDAYQGLDGIGLAREALLEGRPFSVAFIDMRMPPGLDGLQTARALLNLDPRLQIVICTAYSDRPWQEMREQLDPQEGLLVVKKPFDPIEIWQAAVSLSAHWDMARQSEATIAKLQTKLDEYSHLLQLSHTARSLHTT